MYQQARPICARAMQDGNYDELADRLMENNYVPQEMARMVACAAASIRHSSRRRPKMSQVCMCVCVYIYMMCTCKQVQETIIRFNQIITLTFNGTF